MGYSTSFVYLILTVIVITVIRNSGVSGSSSSNSKCESKKKEWNKNLTSYPKLKEYIESRTIWQVLDPENGEPISASRSLVFLNWQDDTFRLKCPLPDVIEWKLRDRDGIEDEEFGESYHKSRAQVLSTKAEKKYEYLRTYSCKSSSCCWHHFNVITRPWPKTSHPIMALEGSEVEFTCAIYPFDYSDLKKKEGIRQNAPFKIHWNFPATNSTEKPSNVNITNEESNDLGMIKSTITILNSSVLLNSGVHECIVTDRFNVTSAPLTKILASKDSRFQGYAHVHIRSLNYIWTALITLLVMILIIPLMIRFLPTNMKEADLEEEDNVSGSQTIHRNGREGSSESNNLRGSMGSGSGTKSSETKLLRAKDE